ncbi:hypothetical protein D187_005244 [Cystobacter fuscus DSM 2262]|uniref:Uncharacterized protein n=2 Tax=Cystobacter fuscus TaxID=43 RepID=S9PM97_CYSF2|nr:hypothetical protein D187_005244 [Cystobacter fuscus DSM 2262]
MLIGVGHATVVYRTQNGFVHVNPSTDVNSIRVEFAQQINVQVVQGDNDYALRVTGVGNPNFVIAGNFIALLR